MNPIQELLIQIPEIERKTKYTFKNKQLLVLAFVHRSFFQ